MDTKEYVVIGHVNHNTQIQFFFQDDSVITSPEQPLSSSTSIGQLVGGLEGPKQQLQEILNSALFLSSRYKELHIPVPKGVLLYGPPGSGKTLLVRSLVSCFHTSFFTVSISALVSQYLGESERRLTELFNQARLAAPAIIFLDEIDALCPPRDRANATSSRLCSLLLALFDEVSERVVVIGATNRCLEDVKRALPRIRPSALREITVVSPNVHWSDIGGLETVKSKMKELIEWPMLYASQLARFHINPPKGVLLYGPPGCSKTLLAKAVATEANMNFISVKGPELYSKYVGESEQALATVFRRARLSAPCVIFFDEIDAFAVDLGVTERVVSQFLTELDGIHMLKRVLVIAATNRPDLLDVALLRPGRLDTHIFLGLPDLEAREKILNVHLKAVPLADDVVVREIAEKTEGYSGAELAAVCTEASMEALDENINAEAVHQTQLLHSLAVVRPRTSPELLQLYLRFNEKRKWVVCSRNGFK
ncbi:ATPase [Blastocystis sp. subtype 4]|uniref:ATPase n=1 Tax=Blastocystis sp. subtype 4 TaxID=944170 RepID=UPI0007119478|nr:ATPase [Blastocystis sp. subtype 4]KNB43455.1 ATPase [Blastocystis sp. subtype 4]|eukprot:XP_014526898.1 ATPase [Blastocystis sp. subtype 4]